MSYAKRVVRCTGCGNIMTAKVNSDEDQFLIGSNECPECGCEDFDILEVGGFDPPSTATDD